MSDDPRLALAIEILGEDLGRRLMAAEKTGVLYLDEIEFDMICRERPLGAAEQITLSPSVKIVVKKKPTVETIALDLEI